MFANLSNCYRGCIHLRPFAYDSAAGSSRQLGRRIGPPGLCLGLEGPMRENQQQSMGTFAEAEREIDRAGTQEYRRQQGAGRCPAYESRVRSCTRRSKNTVYRSPGAIRIQAPNARLGHCRLRSRLRRGRNAHRATSLAAARGAAGANCNSCVQRHHRAISLTP